MAGQTFTDDIDCVSFFDDLIQFPSVSDKSLDSVDCNDFVDTWINNSDELQVSDPIFSDSNSASTLSAVLAVPYEDIVQLEWLSNFVEDSFSGGGMTMSKEHIPVKKEQEPEPLVVGNYQFQMSSPVSVLESSSSSSSSSSCSGGGSGGMMIPLTSSHRGPQRARSKRPRPPTFTPRVGIELQSPSTFIPVPGSMESENLEESHNGPRSGGGGPDQKKRKKPKKPEAEFNPEDKTEKQNQNQNQNQHHTGHGVRKCMHCEITKTPQWRAGPMGPKTLCNACGVRYKSGRLFPEYRPAASPTFVPSLHSNSHKKVVEMRTKCMPNDAMARLCTPEPELIPNMNPPADYM